MRTVEDARAEMRDQVRRITRNTLAGDLAWFDSLPIIDPHHRRQLRTSVAAASVRKAIAESLPQERANNLSNRLVWLPAVVALPWFLLAGHGNLVQRLLLFAVGFAGGCLVLWASLKVIPSGRRVSRAGGTTGVAYLTLVPTLSIVITIANVNHFTATALALLAGWDTVCSMLLSMGIVVSAGIAVGTLQVGRLCRPYDLALLQAVIVTSDIHSMRNRWNRASTVRRACQGLEFLATVTERDLALRGRYES